MTIADLVSLGIFALLVAPAIVILWAVTIKTVRDILR